MEAIVISFDGLWSVVLDGHAVYATHSKSAALANALNSALDHWAKHKEPAVVLIQDADGREREIARFGETRRYAMAS